ncbi:unnamed protein product [Linum tenue]|uniref:Uncharacterized protein n=1 Tax=Linum tenue TaxID=586396 RepID=A0AAV0S0K3_9ROSI|nr:unnamed protein product [Linum tenue]
MASDTWGSRFSTTRRYQSRPDPFEEGEMEDDSKAEFLCPFCAEDFDILGLCCHMDEEHPVETKNGVSISITSHHYPLLSRFSLSLTPHVQRKRRLRKGGSNSPFAILRKELRDGSFQSLLGGSSYFVSSTEPDPLLSSFMFSPAGLNEPKSIPPTAATDVATSPAMVNAIEESLEREVEPSSKAVSDKDQEERSRRCEFVRGLVLSTILDEL